MGHSTSHLMNVENVDISIMIFLGNTEPVDNCAKVLLVQINVKKQREDVSSL